MRRSVTVITLIVLLLTAGSGAAWWWWPTAESAASCTAKASYQPAAWRVEFDNGESALLFGTIHVGRADFYPLPAPVAVPLANASCLVMELDMSAPDYQAVAASGAQRYGYLPPDLKLSTLLPEGLWPEVDATARKMGLVPLVSERMEPWLLASTVQVMTLASLGYQPALGVDQHLTMAASHTSEQAIIGLESVEQQLQIISRDRAGGIEMLRQTVINDPAREGKRLIEAWRQGDIAEFEALLSEATSNGPGQQLMTDLLVTRNRNWVEQLEEIWADERCSVAVGAMHLVGPESLVELLRQRGYRIERLDYAAADEE
ncbi:MAG: TraB/GumN family protein [Gammaproteobacteria bacterium]|nr:TraB/GumN family protein [Gammaproteobacteria bacterium]